MFTLEEDDTLDAARRLAAAGEEAGDALAALISRPQPSVRLALGQS
jgi:hypothetical protein